MKIINILLLLLFTTSINAKVVSEDEQIIRAIYYIEHNKNREASLIWKELFEVTNNQKYLIEYFYSALSYKDIKEVIKELKSSLGKKKSKELYELLASLYSKEGNTDGVLEVVESLKNDDAESMYELAYLYSINGKQNKSLNIYKKLYKKEKSWEALKGILSILSVQGKTKEATDILWRAIKSKKMPKDAYLVYVGLIDYKKDTKKAIFTFKKLLKITHDRRYIKQLISLYLFSKDYDSIIKILNKSRYDDKLLYELLLSKQKFVRAYMVLYRLYESSKDARWLTEKAILTYEIASKYKAIDSRVISRVSELFDRSIKRGVSSPTYYNYYGYILIDHNKDIKKGISLVKKAVSVEPKNIYYLDSLAWGYYKLKDCNRAKKVVDKIVKIKSKNLEPDIKQHIKIIKKCKVKKDK